MRLEGGSVVFVSCLFYAVATLFLGLIAMSFGGVELAAMFGVRPNEAITFLRALTIGAPAGFLLIALLAAIRDGRSLRLG